MTKQTKPVKPDRKHNVANINSIRQACGLQLQAKRQPKNAVLKRQDLLAEEVVNLQEGQKMMAKELLALMTRLGDGPTSNALSELAKD